MTKPSSLRHLDCSQQWSSATRKFKYSLQAYGYSLFDAGRDSCLTDAIAIEILAITEAPMNTARAVDASVQTRQLCLFIFLCGAYLYGFSSNPGSGTVKPCTSDALCHLLLRTMGIASICSSKMRMPPGDSF